MALPNEALLGKLNRMPTRKELRGVAAGIAGHFVSRYNDVNGYWALGLFYKAAVDAGQNFFKLNILSGESTPEFRYSKRVSSDFHEMLLKQLAARGFDELNVLSAIVELEFDVELPEQRKYIKTNLGEIFSCRVVITDDLNKQRSFEETGRCRQHDPSREHQSTRAYTS